IPEKDYVVELLTWSDPETTNEVLNYPPIQEYFRLPGNELDVPQNLKISGEGDIINLTWDPIDNNLHDFEYLLKIHLDGNKSDEFGTHYLNDPMFSMSGVQQNLRYWFDVQAVPSRNNKVDVDSETISSFMELTSLTYATPTIRSVKIEPLADDEIPEAVIILAWEESANGDGHQTYWIEIAYDAEFRTGFQDHEAEPGDLEAELGPFDLGKTYYFRMYARGPDEDATRISSERSEVRKLVMPPAIP
ncbi:MAG: hypothetical protein AAEJ57_03100, partial [Opitutales bacterium]